MLNCEYCNYYTEEKAKMESEGSCIFCGYQFQAGDFINDMEYPCSNISYQEYLNKKEVLKPYTVISNENWKIQYELKNPPKRKTKLANAG
jgi:hypothetical protein